MGEEWLTAELLVRLGLRVSPRTGRRYMGRGLGGRGRRAANQRWATFVHSHGQAVVVCDFCVAVTATLRVFYIFVALEVGSRRLVHVNVTSTRGRPGPCSSSGRSSLRRTPPGSSSMTGIAPMHGGWTQPSPHGVRASARRSRLPVQTRMRRARFVASGGRVWTS